MLHEYPEKIYALMGSLWWSRDHSEPSACMSADTPDKVLAEVWRCGYTATTTEHLDVLTYDSMWDMEWKRPEKWGSFGSFCYVTDGGERTYAVYKDSEGKRHAVRPHLAKDGFFEVVWGIDDARAVRF